MARTIDIDLSGDRLLPHQRRFLESKSRYCFMVIGRGGGKSWVLSAMVVLEMLKGHNVLAMAQRYDSIKEVLFAEIKARVFEWGLSEYFSFKESPIRAYCATGATCFTGSFDNIDMCRGLTSIHVLLCDELAMAPAGLFSVLSPCLRGPGVKNPRIVGATTPRIGSMWNVRFSEAEKLGWEIITGTTFDNTKLSKESLDLILDSIPTEEMKQQELYGQILMGNDATRLIHLNEFPSIPGLTTDARVIAGLDCAEGVERDATAFVVRQGTRVLEMWKMNRIDHEGTIKKVLEANRKWKIQKLFMDAAFSDHEFETLKFAIPSEQINFGGAATDEWKHRYANIRAQMFFHAAKAVKAGVCVDGFELTAELKRQLCAIGWLKNNQGRFLVTPKDELREVLRMSTDIGDAFALTFIDLWTGDDPAMKQESVRGVTREEEEDIMSEY